VRGCALFMYDERNSSVVARRFRDFVCIPPSLVCRTAEPFRLFSSSEASDFEQFFFFSIYLGKFAVSSSSLGIGGV
jgi:hypothetical protein